MCSASAAHLASLDPGQGHSTIRWAVLGQRPTQHNQRDLQLEYTTVYWGEFGSRNKKEDWQQLLAPVPIFKKKKVVKRFEQTLKMLSTICCWESAIKITMRHRYVPARMTEVLVNAGQWNPHTFRVGMQSDAATLENRLTFSCKVTVQARSRHLLERNKNIASHQDPI